MKPDGKYVLDSFALLSFLSNEPGANMVGEVLSYGQQHAGTLSLSTINYGECLYIIEREEGLEAAHKAIAAIDQFRGVEVVSADREQTFAAAHIKAHFKVSFADAFAIALAQSRRATVLTGDPEFKQVEGMIPILWLPR